MPFLNYVPGITPFCVSRITLLAGVVAAVSVFAVDSQASPHRHGISELLVALDGDVLTMELLAPGRDIAGFESAPETPEQKDHYAKSVAILKSADKMFALSKAADCKIEDVHLLEQLAANHHEDDHKAGHDTDGHDEEAHGNDEHRDDEKHERAHDKDEHDEDEHDEEVHGEFRVRYVFHCGQPEKLDRIRLPAFEHFPGMQAIEMKFIGSKGVIVRHLSPREPAAGL